MRALFVSDLHIDDSRPHVLAAFERLVEAEAPQVDALYILGDLVEAWVGDDDDGPAADAVRRVLRTAARHCALHVMRGNRDFLLGARFAAETGAALIDDPAQATLGGERVLLAHGDAYCTRDGAYQAARETLRSTAWQAGVLAMGLPERRALAATLRARSAAENANKPDNIMDVTPAAVEAALDAAGARTLIHGHTHRPGIHDLGGGRRRIVLGDWHRCGWKLTVDDDGAALSCFAL